MKPTALIWRADPSFDADDTSRAVAEDPTDPEAWTTGHAPLDAELPDGGWPKASLIELLIPSAEPHPASRSRSPAATSKPSLADGGLVWSLLAPGLSRRGLADGPVLCVTPPQDPYAPALERLGVPASRILRVQPAQAKDAAWAAEQGARAQACTAVLWWVCAHMPADALNTSMRRLHLAAQAGRTPVFMLRAQAVQAQASPAPLRLRLDQHEPGRLALTIVKRRGVPMTRPMHLPLVGLPTALLRRAQQTTMPAVVQPMQPVRSAPPLLPEFQPHAVVGLASASLAA